MAICSIIISDGIVCEGRRMIWIFMRLLKKEEQFVILKM